jgi:hypothetical protein
MRTFAQKQARPQKPVPLARSNTVTLGHHADPILHLQRMIGNQAVKRMAQASQPKLAVNKPGDEYEQEAERISEQVMRMPEPRLQRSCGGGYPRSRTQPPGLGCRLTSSGQPLDHQTRRFMESRFGHDFSHVRVHTDSRAAESARAVGALAYTVGQDVVFGAGRFSAQSIEGKRLLAHELTHVVQQKTARTSALFLQRAPDEKQTRQDVVVVGEGVEGSEVLARVLARGGLILRVKSMDEVAAALGAIDFPIGTLYFETHSFPDGGLQFGAAEGIIKPADIAGRLKGVIHGLSAPKHLDFRGCSVGTNPKAMDQIRKAIGAKTVVAGHCFAVNLASEPIKIGGKDITKASDVTAARRPLFERLRKGTVANFGAAQRCILNRGEKDFFAAGGRFVSLFFNPEPTKTWIQGKSVCYKDLKPLTVDPKEALSKSDSCRLIMVGEEELDRQSGASDYHERGRNVPGR